MKRLIFISLFFPIIIFSCKNTTKSKVSETENKITDTVSDTIEKSDDSQGFFYKYDGDGSFDDFLSFFKEEQLPFETSIVGIYGVECESHFPAVFNKYLDIEKYAIPEDLPLYSCPIAKIKISDKTWLVYYALEDSEYTYTTVLATFRNNTEIDSREVPYEHGFDVSTYLSIDKDYNIYAYNEYVVPVFYWAYENKVVYRSPAHTEDYEELLDCKLTEDGKFYDVQKIKTVADTVRSFLNYLGNDKHKAYEKQNNPNWGDFDKFSSKEAFGGIYSVKIDSLSLISKNDSLAQVLCIATYFDNINGNMHVQEIFYLTKTNGEWIITDMKVNDFSKFGYYYSGDFQDSDLEITNVTDSGFNFLMFVISNQGEDDYYYAGQVQGYATFIEPNHAVFKDDGCQLDFYLNGLSSVKIVDSNCKKYRNSNISFSSTFELSKSTEPNISNWVVAEY